ncbi:acetyl-CoA synthetase-like protein [Ceraceosorus guamensis]|uniref:Acetyl-CoA synthetase-like protein n=1 Tax=Ceraceosorus guamensis TaxID=1522189 RepID=A0A316W5K2_9BASI|nr:acetyl-CoA synthetase-like protein [Ceraceosorus guamensis]PWN44011.1 acetyl-CoA synthetase-like protein [Ceraceosorus guamensis]
MSSSDPKRNVVGASEQQGSPASPEAEWQSARQAFGSAEALPFASLRPVKEIDDILTKLPGSPFEIEEKVIKGVLTKTWKNLPASVAQFWTGCAQLYRRREYLVYEDVRVTYKEAWEQSLIIAHWLRSQFAVRKGDKVGLLMRNIPEFVIAYFAIQLLGGVAVVLNAFSDSDTLDFCVKDVQCRVLLLDPERLHRIQTIFPRLSEGLGHAGSVEGIAVCPRDGRMVLPKEKRPWMDGKLGPLVFDWQELQHRWSPTLQLSRPPPVVVQPEDPSTILFTSGTTSRPKGVISTQRQNLSSMPLSSYGTARAFLRRHRALPLPAPDAQQRCVLLCVPFFHTTGLHSGISLTTASGSRLCMLHKWDLKDAITTIQREKCHSVTGVGFMLREIVSSGAPLPSLEVMGHGGASTPRETVTEVSGKLKSLLVGQGYGLTEVNGVACGIYADDYVHRPDSIGLPPPTVELCIVDPTSLVRLTKPEEEGELWIKSPGVASYFNRPEANAESFMPDGWFRTGDLAKQDQAGFYYITGRAKEMIIRGGENISTVHVENAAFSHPEVKDCSAFPLPCKIYGERVGLVVVLHKKEALRTIKAKDIIHHASQTLPKFARPEYVHLTTTPLPRNPNGKVIRKQVTKTGVEQALKDGWSSIAQSSARESKL